MFSTLSSRIAAAITGSRASISRGALLGAGVVAATLGMAACSTSNVLELRPDVDVGSQTAAVPSGGGMQNLVPNDPYLQQAEIRQEAAREMAVEAPAVMASQPAEMSRQVAMVQPPDMSRAIETSQPMETGRSVETSEPVEPQESEPEQSTAPVLAAYPRMNQPQMSAPAPKSSDEVACRRELKSLGVVYRDLPPIHDSASCSVDDPIKVSVLPGNVELKPAATLNCEMALTFAKWTKNELNPAARMRYWSRVKTIHQLSSYSCRRINGSRTMSAHSQGNAIDVGRIELASGRDIDVEKPGLFAFRTRGFLNNVRADGCQYFTTVLGPGYNWDHRNHFHFDLMTRRNGRRACH
ncbi:extensin family protein [Mesorhizobium sp. BAC0120]|uniref:extensin-like domain-containing protein n=1 Tax=Mesorhizobium sp. BAC0120 TaxID=3090670 RepID=UPI00399A26C8